MKDEKNQGKCMGTQSKKYKQKQDIDTKDMRVNHVWKLWRAWRMI